MYAVTKTPPPPSRNNTVQSPSTLCSDARRSNDLYASDTPKNGTKPETQRRMRTEVVISACSQCRKRKTKCSAERPVCSYCDRRGLDCSWDVLDGLTRLKDLKRKVQEAEMRLHQLRILVEAMRTGSDQVSTTLLARLRLGASVDELVQSLPSIFEGSISYELHHNS